MARLACTKPGATPEVGPAWALRRMAWRAANPVCGASASSFRIVAIAMARSCSIPHADCPLYHQGRAETYRRPPPPPRRCYTQAAWHRRHGQFAKTVETKPNIAFANGTNSPPRARQGSAGRGEWATIAFPTPGPATDAG